MLREELPGSIKSAVYEDEVAMGVWGGEVWVFRWHDDHWCSHHKADKAEIRNYQFMQLSEGTKP